MGYDLREGDIESMKWLAACLPGDNRASGFSAKLHDARSRATISGPPSPHHENAEHAKAEFEVFVQ